MRIVLDTNVFIAGLLSPHGPPGQIMNLAAAGKITLCHDLRIVEEYRTVARRPKFRIDPGQSEALIDYLFNSVSPVVAAPLPYAMPDPDDAKFLEVAVAAQVDFLVTGNIRHFPARERMGVTVISPREFVDRLRKAT